MLTSVLAHHLIVAVLVAPLLLALAFVVGRGLLAVVSAHRAGGRVKVAKRRCKYCLFGRALMTEQKVHIEQDDLVSVRCWACTSCGLPHWTVRRSPVLKPVSFDK